MPVAAINNQSYFRKAPPGKNEVSRFKGAKPSAPWRCLAPGCASIFLSTRFRKCDWNIFRALATIYSPSLIAVMAQSAFFAAAID